MSKKECFFIYFMGNIYIEYLGYESGVDVVFLSQ
jgi:hypothetical protein